MRTVLIRTSMLAFSCTPPFLRYACGRRIQTSSPGNDEQSFAFSRHYERRLPQFCFSRCGFHPLFRFPRCGNGAAPEPVPFTNIFMRVPDGEYTATIDVFVMRSQVSTSGLEQSPDVGPTHERERKVVTLRHQR